MKSYYFIIFLLWTFLVISSKASTINQINDKYKIEGGGYKVWLSEVNGYNKTDPVNGYAGILGEPITSLRINGGKKYRVHLLGGKWLPPVTGNDQTEDVNGYAGMVNGQPIDAVVIGGGVEYTVHLLKGGWLAPVSGYNLTDSKHGYAGSLGEPIDAIMIKNRTYAVSYTDIAKDEDLCTIQGGSCINPNSCDGIVLTGLCPGNESIKCCLSGVRVNTNDNSVNTPTNNLQNNSNNHGKLIAFIILISVLAVIIVIAIFFYFRNVLFNYVDSNASFIVYTPNPNNNNNNNHLDNESLPTYHEVMNEETVGESSHIVLGSSSDHEKKHHHSQIIKKDFK